MSEITQEDLMGLKYIWDKTGDLTRWAFWEEKKMILNKEYPLLLISFNQIQLGQISVDFFLKKAIDES